MKPITTPTIYEIRVRGHLGPSATAWFPGMSITRTASGETILYGTVIDQSSLHGYLMRIRDLGLVLTLVRSVEEQSERNENGEEK